MAEMLDMTTSFGVPLAAERIPALRVRRTVADKYATGALTLTFLLSFLQYCLERSDAVRLVPVGLLIVSALILLLLCHQDKRRMLLTSAVSPAMVLLIAAACIPALISSLYRPLSYPFQYGLVLVATLFAVRIVLSVIGLEGMLLSFFYGTTLGVLIVAGLSLSDLVTSLGATRYSPLFFDPNRIGFFAVTAIPAQLWFANRQRGKKYILLVSALCVLMIMAAASRGSTGALAIGVTIGAVLYVARTLKHGSFAITKAKVIGALAVLCLLTAIAAVAEPGLERAGNYLWTKLDLGSRARGLDSGFTGRAANWTIVLGSLPRTSWVVGNGYRTSDDDFSFPIDNGYLASIYELGLVSAVVVLAKYVAFSYESAVAYILLNSGACLVALVFTMVIFLSNAFVHRVLFGSGDPASIVALFVFVSTRHDILEAAHPQLTSAH